MPDLVTMLTIPPRARPYSAPKLLFTTRNSLTASCEGVARWEDVTVLMVSAPSTVTILLKSRMPPKETRVTSNSVNVDCKLVRPMATPGVNRAKSVNRRPLIGKLWICCISMTWLISVRVVSTGGTSVLTVTVSPTVATFSVMLTVAAWPTVSWIFVWVYFAKPG